MDSLECETLIVANHIDLFGKEAKRFDEIVESITEPNVLMSEILKEVYETGRITTAST